MSLPTDHPVGRIYAFTKPNNANKIHVNTQTLCICTYLIGCLGNSEPADVHTFRVLMLFTFTVLCAGSEIGR